MREPVRETASRAGPEAGRGQTAAGITGHWDSLVLRSIGFAPELMNDPSSLAQYSARSSAASSPRKHMDVEACAGHTRACGQAGAGAQGADAADANGQRDGQREQRPPTQMDGAVERMDTAKRIAEDLAAALSTLANTVGLAEATEARVPEAGGEVGAQAPGGQVMHTEKDLLAEVECGVMPVTIITMAPGDEGNPPTPPLPLRPSPAAQRYAFAANSCRPPPPMASCGAPVSCESLPPSPACGELRQAGGFDALEGLMRNMRLHSLVASRLAKMVQERRPADEREQVLDAQAISAHLTPEDIARAWVEGLEDEVTRAFDEQLRLLKHGEEEAWEEAREVPHRKRLALRAAPPPLMRSAAPPPAQAAAKLEGKVLPTPPAAVSPLIPELDKFMAAQQSTTQATDKFADATFEKSYRTMDEFLGSGGGWLPTAGHLARRIGLPARKLFEGMQRQCCSGAGAEQEFAVSRYDSSVTTPKLEWEFVCHPDLRKVYPGGRHGVLLDVFNLAHGAVPRDGGERLDLPLQAAALAQIAAKNRCSEQELMDSVKTVALRAGRTLLQSIDHVVHALAEERLEHAGYTLLARCRSSEVVAGLEALVAMGAHKLSQVRRAVGEALREAPRIETTGERSFAAVAKSVQHLVSRDVLEALVLHARAALMAACMCEEEIIALRIHTGPLRARTNAVLRSGVDKGDGQTRSHVENNYCNVIYAIVSGLTKLSQASDIQHRTLYRSWGGARLPACFYSTDVTGPAGGVELAFLSATASRCVAAQRPNAGQEASTLLCINPGAFVRGASVEHLSQYPDEEEVLMPPGSWLKVVGEPEMVSVEDGLGVMLSIPLQILCPPTATIEEERARRKTTLLSLANLALLEISRDLDSLATSDLAIQRAKLDQSCTPAAAQQFQIHPTDEPSLHNVGLVPAIEAECRTWVTRTIERSEPADFHDDEHYRRMIKETCELPRLALGKVQIWLEDSASLAWHIKRMTLTEADRHACGIWTRRLHGAASTQAKGLHLLEECGVAAALHMCRMQGLVVSSPTEVIDAASGETMLMRQAALGATPAVRLLVNAGAKLDAKDCNGQTALMLAAGAGHRETVVALATEFGAHVNMADEIGWTPVVAAAFGGHTPTVESLLIECRAAVDVTALDGSSPMHAAAAAGHTSTVLVLVKKGRAEVNAIDKTGSTPLHLAATAGFTETAKALVQFKADVNLADKAGQSPLLVAAKSGKTSTVSALVRECNAYIDALDNNGQSAVFAAARKGHTATVVVLLKECWANIWDAEGQTPVHVAVRAGFTKTVVALVNECSADINAVGLQGLTPLQMAIRHGDTAMIACLVNELDADVMASNEGGVSCLHLAAGAKDAEKASKMIQILVDQMRIHCNEALAKEDSVMAWTPIHYALYCGHKELARTLAERLFNNGGTTDAALDDWLGKAERAVFEEHHQSLSLLRGLPCDAKVCNDGIEFNWFSTIRSTFSCPRGSKGYFELEILDIGEKYRHRYGFATGRCKRVPGVSNAGLGDDDQSWAVSGKGNKARHNGNAQPYACNWRAGDVVGLACDLSLDNTQILVSVNGSYSTPNGSIFKLDPATVHDGLFAAFSGASGKVRCNFGEQPFKHAPPSAGFSPFADFRVRSGNPLPSQNLFAP